MKKKHAWQCCIFLMDKKRSVNLLWGDGTAEKRKIVDAPPPPPPPVVPQHVMTPAPMPDVFIPAPVIDKKPFRHDTRQDNAPDREDRRPLQSYNPMVYGTSRDGGRTPVRNDTYAPETSKPKMPMPKLAPLPNKQPRLAPLPPPSSSTPDPAAPKPATVLDDAMRITIRNLEGLVKHQQHELATRRAKADKVIEDARAQKDIITWNCLIVEYGNNKQFDVVEHILKDIREAGVKPTVYTYTNLINACVRCGEYPRSLEFLRMMHKEGVRANEVTYTALVKGLCEQGDMKEAMNVYDEMIMKKLHPNIRTYNTLLRGCVRNSAPDTAVSLHDSMIRHGVTPDSTSLEYVIKALCQHLRTEEANLYIESLREQNSLSGSPLAAYATACALRGLREKAHKAALEAKRRPQRATYGEIEGSALLFVKLKNKEVVEECNRVVTYMGAVDTVLTAHPPMLEHERVIFLDKMEEGKHIKFKRVFGRKMPLKLEICSGHGDWLIQRATNDKESGWVGLEIRRDRIHSIYTRMCMNRADNVAILCGDAQSGVDHIKHHVFTEAYINFPNPPVWEGNSQRLITKEFLVALHASIVSGGTLTVVTDEPAYASDIVRDVHATGLYSDVAFETSLPTNYGSSYFDEFWSNGGKRKNRYYMVFKA